ncbi:hypothetical protein ACOJUR_02150 [Alicyclobacillus tolerans]|uniref:DUF2642 domain-containing protein n=2 Tax=Alicyclobacillus tolerans TaxID=90970 RepID=A0A1M6RAS8_9BACL|nr:MULTISPECIES: hypothetical protein [Alicyclobacillus]MDP9729459.1 hypothetical protein [Alicyclobacillus tengchongensis]QRF22379.1 hypothetical protein FY534_00800 [Alicyclobacillus sp. TC]SHK29585.1 hypothetical protein SAMN05443507_111106 [Alicyclobacillus montanus]
MIEDLRRAFTLGDRIKVYAGDTQIDGTGSFIAFQDRFLIWADSTGLINFTHLGDAITIQKV